MVVLGVVHHVRHPHQVVQRARVELRAAAIEAEVERHPASIAHRLPVLGRTRVANRSRVALRAKVHESASLHDVLAGVGGREVDEVPRQLRRLGRQIEIEPPRERIVLSLALRGGT